MIGYSSIIVFLWCISILFHQITSIPSSTKISSMKLMNITVIGGGAFGTAITRRIALNFDENKNLSQEFSKSIRLWMMDELVDGKSLVDTLNNDHVNRKYLPDILLPNNIIADRNIVECAKYADIILLAVPHQFMMSVIDKVRGYVKNSVIAISLSKGVVVEPSGPRLISNMITKELGIKECGVLMGANLANDLAKDDFVETVIASKNQHTIDLLKRLLSHKSFHIQTSTDVSSVELCGAWKNVVAMGVGFCDGLGYSLSTKSAVMRQGIVEMNQFCKMCRTNESDFDEKVVFQSCGIADVIASSFGGRNSACSAEFIKRLLKLNLSIEDNINKPSMPTSTEREQIAKQLWIDIERDILQGQKLQGPSTCIEALECIKYFESIRTKSIPKFPLLRKIYGIANGFNSPSTLCDWID